MLMKRVSIFSIYFLLAFICRSTVFAVILRFVKSIVPWLVRCPLIPWQPKWCNIQLISLHFSAFWCYNGNRTQIKPSNSWIKRSKWMTSELIEFLSPPGGLLCIAFCLSVLVTIKKSPDFKESTTKSLEKNFITWGQRTNGSGSKVMWVKSHMGQGLRSHGLSPALRSWYRQVCSHQRQVASFSVGVSVGNSRKGGGLLDRN